MSQISILDVWRILVLVEVAAFAVCTVLQFAVAVRLFAKGGRVVTGAERELRDGQSLRAPYLWMQTVRRTQWVIWWILVGTILLGGVVAAFDGT